MEKTQLKFKSFRNGEKCILAEDYLYEINGYILKIPKGFETDGASTPLVLRPFYPAFGKYTEAAVVHDYLYSEKNDTGINRKLADKIFLHIMKECGVSEIKRKKMYKAVRIFGGIFWKKKICNEGYKDQALIDRTEEAVIYYKKWEKILGKL